MAAPDGPGRGAQINNTSTNHHTPSSRTTFKPQVSGLISKFNQDTMSGNSLPSTEDSTSTASTTQDEYPPLPPSTDTTPEGTPEGAAGGAPTEAAQTAEERLANEIVLWATRADRTNTEQPYSLTIWFRKNSTASNTTLSLKEKGRLVFKRLGVPRGKCLNMDDSRRDRIVLKISGDVPVSTLNLTQSFEAKTNLHTKPVAPVIKEKWVYVYWTSNETRYTDIEDALGYFGAITGPIEYQVYRAGPNADEEERLMDGVLSMNRQVKMKVKKNIPSIILIGDKKANIRYEGQAKSCPRCLLRLHVCPTRGDPRRCQELWDQRFDEGEGPHKRAKPRGDLREMMDAAMGRAATWGDGNVMDSSDDTNRGIKADYVDVCNVPEEMDETKIVDFLKTKDISIERGQLERDETVKTKWRIKELMPQEVECVMLLVNGAKIGSSGKKIQCFPMMMSTPPGNGQPWFAPSRDTSEVGVPPVDPAIVRDLTAEMRDLEEGDEVSPNTNVSLESDPEASSSVNVANTLLKDSSGSSVEVINGSGNGDDEVKLVDADNKTIPDKGDLKTKIVKAKDGSFKTEEVKKKMDSVSKPKNGGTPKALGAKARQTLKTQVDAAKGESELAQKDAEVKAAKANDTRDEDDLKKAEKAEKAAATAKKKFLLLEGKWDKAMKQAADLKKMSETGKRTAENQSPGKEDGEDDSDWNVAGGGKGSKNKNPKKKPQKEKSKEELEIEKSLFNEQ